MSLESAGLTVNVAQHSEQGVALDVFPKRKPLGVLVGFGESIVFFCLAHAGILRMRSGPNRRPDECSLSCSFIR